MKLQLLTNQIPKHGCTLIEGAHILFIARSHQCSYSAIGLAVACTMHGIPYICASPKNRCGWIVAALGRNKVVELPDNALDAEVKYFDHLIERARRERAILLIDAIIPKSYEFGDLLKLLQLRRGDTLTTVLSIAPMGDPGYEKLWNCKPNQCVVHSLGVPGASTLGKIRQMWELMPTWHSGELSKGAYDVITRRKCYRNLPTMDKMASLMSVMTDEHPMCLNPNFRDAAELLIGLGAHTSKYIFDGLVEHIV